jgi:large subunit ribosomal protein L25
MQEITLEAEVRHQTGKGRALRRMGKVPGIFYLHGEENITIAVPERSLHQFIHSAETHIINLKLNDGRMKSCILREIQFDPVTDRPQHVDFQGVRADERLTIEVPIIIAGGTPQGVKDGGVLQHVMHKLRISCLPKDIPEHIEVNAEQLAINHSIHVRELTVPNVTILDSQDATVVAVIPPTVEKVVEPGAVAVEEITEPEVIAKGKKEEEGEEGATETKKEAKAEPAAKKEEKK